MLLLLVINSWVLAYINIDPIMGQIRTVSQVDKIAIDTDESPIYAVFYWDEEMQLWVRVLGQTGTQLGEFDLGNASQITLSGGGRFTLEVFSISGIGNWEVDFSKTSSD